MNEAQPSSAPAAPAADDADGADGAAPERRPESPLRRIATASAIVCLLLLANAALRRSVGFEATGDWLRNWVADFGLWAPAVYVALVIARHFLLLPSSLLLALGGAAFGVVGGTLAGGIGLYLNGLLVFFLFRAVRPESLVHRMEARYAGTQGRAVALVERSAPLVLFLVTAVPPAPHTPVYGLASLTRIAYAHFALVTLPAAFVRSVLLSLLGAGLVESNPWAVAGSLAAIAIGLGLSWLSPTMRALLLPRPLDHDAEREPERPH